MPKYMIAASSRPSVRALTSLSSPGGGVLNVLKEQDGSVTALDRFKKYYKAAIAFCGSLLVVLNTLTPAFDSLPVNGKYLTTAVAIVTAISVLLKRNETWVEEL